MLINCGYGIGFSVLQIINNFNKILKKKIEYKYGPRRKGDVEKVVANCKKIKKTFKWRPKFDKLKIILQSALDWEKKINKNYK